jgi:molecular chaperone DnaK (HSP70)
MWLGIDFGTCYSSAAFLLNGTLERVKDSRRLGYSFPSSVFVTEEGEVLVGHTADYQRNKAPNRYRREFKRELGKENSFFVGDRQFCPEDLVTEVLRKLKGEADQMLKSNNLAPFTEAVITVPATYQDHKRKLMRKAALNAGFTQVELLEEPVATALYYAQRQIIEDGEIILVYDLGGGTFDATLIQSEGAGYRLLTLPVGLEHCGGIDFDRKIYEDLLHQGGPTIKELLNPQRRDLEALRAKLTLADWCQEAKHQLSEINHFEDMVPGFFSETYKLNRGDFNWMIRPHIEQTLERCNQLLNDAGLDWQRVARILLVGGSCRIPYIHEVLVQEFKRPVVRVDDPELAVCLGAAIYRQVDNLSKHSQTMSNSPLNQGETAEEYLKASQTFYNSKNYSKAIEALNKGLKIESNSIDMLVMRGNSFLCIEHYQKAMENYDQAINLNTHNIYALNMRELARRELEAIKFNPSLNIRVRTGDFFKDIYFNHISISNLPPEVTEDDLRDLVCKYGVILNIELKFEQGYRTKKKAHIEMLNNIDCYHTVSEVSRIEEWMGRKINVLKYTARGRSDYIFI